MNNKKLVFLVLTLIIAAILPIHKQTDKISSVNNPDKTPSIETEAKSALVLDLLTGEIIFEKNILEPLPLASLTKIVSSLVVADHIDLNEKVKENIQTEDLLALSMGESSNSAMTALVEYMGDEKWFLELMREKARELGTETMSFLSPTGLDIEEGGGGSEVASNFGSARDLAQVVKNSLDSVIWQIGNKKGIKNTNILFGEIAGIAGSKTGFTDKAGGNLILIVERPLGKPKLIIILGSTLNGRFEDAKKLVTLLK